MSRQIREADWKVFRELHSVALERFCARILQELQAEIEDPTRSPHETYLSLFTLIHKRNKEMADAFDNYRRSTALFQIGMIRSLGLFTPEELQRFSPETLALLEMLYG